MAPTWVITGSSSGIGLALVRYNLAQGHNVIATSRNPSKTPDLVREVTSHPNGRWLSLDVTSPKVEIERILQEAWREFDGIDFLVNNAGYSVLGAAEDIPEDRAKEQFGVNFWGAVRTTQAILPLMRSRKSGTVVNISSVAGVDPLPTCAIYSASKFALEAWSESLSEEVRPLGVRVLVVEPGGFRTNFFSDATMQFVPPSSAYSEGPSPVSRTLGKFKSINPTTFTDPIKAAQRIFEVVVGVGMGEQLSDHVLRLPLGPDCYTRVTESHKKRQRELEDVKAIALSTI
ncbi:uncharacterized protein Z518_01247 [Rhinocladiella mackenziei CBS 650.93]|uniref:Rhinocladiella mackenziei CBS 650.93 unplaced genomic scaffold supercont1.1, whole genome shotgun sequence n=1 Tax=Rhinocladiella mackenziei CBS 650.93 TaxID=1442369 RepID=A0A0D2J3A4_9EURO|nr:uncharacterized protein Z518_01247 [Rhinocladiella mackenziei CBS 650.93]KIX10166.1 hypothetical protein Z518_01247 [Rhinocladiella mackenziei CBS 650.93]